MSSPILHPVFTEVLQLQVLELENINKENESTKQDIMQGWKMQVQETQVHTVNAVCGDYNGRTLRDIKIAQHCIRSKICNCFMSNCKTGQ